MTDPTRCPVCDGPAVVDSGRVRLLHLARCRHAHRAHQWWSALGPRSRPSDPADQLDLDTVLGSERRDARRRRVAELTDDGMSGRAIAAELGVSEATVRLDRAASS